MLYSYSLKELEGEFIKVIDGKTSYKTGISYQEADGVTFLCPSDFKKNNGDIGTSHVICWFVGKVPDELDPKPGRWNPSGTSIDDLTFVGPGSFSIKCGEYWHGFIKNGRVEVDQDINTP
jgi:hypothetical protein